MCVYSFFFFFAQTYLITSEIGKLFSLGLMPDELWFVPPERSCNVLRWANLSVLVADGTFIVPQQPVSNILPTFEVKFQCV